MVARVHLGTPISDEELMRVGRENPGWKVELVDGAIQMVPTGFESGIRNARLTAMLTSWGAEHGYLVTDSSTGYKLANKDVLAPDCALVGRARADALTPEQRATFCPLAPDVVAELVSKSDSYADARRKCERWYRDGVAYVVLLDPERGAEAWGESPSEFPAPDALLAAILRD